MASVYSPNWQKNRNQHRPDDEDGADCIKDYFFGYCRKYRSTPLIFILKSGIRGFILQQCGVTISKAVEYLAGGSFVDNGQIELTKILTSVFSTFYAHVEFRRVQPVDHKLFQVADVVCTMELLAEKAESNSFSKSEHDFFGSPRDFHKEYLKSFLKKRL